MWRRANGISTAGCATPKTRARRGVEEAKKHDPRASRRYTSDKVPIHGYIRLVNSIVRALSGKIFRSFHRSLSSLQRILAQGYHSRLHLAATINFTTLLSSQNEFLNKDRKFDALNSR